VSIFGVLGLSADLVLATPVMLGVPGQVTMLFFRLFCWLAVLGVGGVPLGCCTSNSGAHALTKADQSPQMPPGDERSLRAREEGATSYRSAFATEKDEVTGQTKFSFASGACSLEVGAKVEGEDLLIVRQSNCALAPEAYLALWSDLLEEIISELRFVGNTIYLQWGRIAAPQTDALAVLLSHRMALAARASKTWNKKRGEPAVRTSLNDLIREQFVPESLFPELVAVADSLGFSVRTGYVEKVLVGSPSSWPGEPPKDMGANERLPYDAQIVFVLRKLRTKALQSDETSPRH
jgi:hypothetical protein